MEDYILKEIDKIGKVVEAILIKLGLLKKNHNGEAIYKASKTELLEKLDLNIDTLLEDENIVAILKEYGFTNNNLDKFAELLFDLTSSTEDKTQRIKLITGINEIYKYLDNNASTFSVNRYYILKELNKYT